ncbi:MAG: hypothetical protein BYD32DRAFT_477586, partial [Podila humilis]
MGGEVSHAYANLIDKLWNGTSKVFSPCDFKSTIGRFSPSFTGYHQHDSQELLAFLLDGLHEDLNRILKKPYTQVPDSNGRPDKEVAADCWNIHKARNDSIIVDLFQGQYKSTLVCPECKKVSVTFDPFMYLSLPLPINKKWIGTVTYVPYDPSKPEQLGKGELWHCPNCKKNQQATKKMDIWRLSDILVVHLKRFSVMGGRHDKIGTFVDFPIQGLDLSGKVLKDVDQNENVYDLYGVSNHIGGLNIGHYTAYVKNEKLDQWYNFDDSHVSPIQEVESIKSASAYLLFYRR